MSIIIENETNIKFDFEYEQVINNVIDESLAYINCPYECEVNVLIVDGNEMQSINKEQREIDSTTDVLSFPMIEYETAGDFSLLEEAQAAAEYFNPESGELTLGDIVINAERVKSQALEFGHSEKRELAFLIAHSMMHLFGFDHMEAEEAKNMELRQETVLDRLGISRD